MPSAVTRGAVVSPVPGGGPGGVSPGGGCGSGTVAATIRVVAAVPWRNAVTAKRSVAAAWTGGPGSPNASVESCSGAASAPRERTRPSTTGEPPVGRWRKARRPAPVSDSAALPREGWSDGAGFSVNAGASHVPALSAEPSASFVSPR
jgi:hypothetical protein